MRAAGLEPDAYAWTVGIKVRICHIRVNLYDGMEICVSDRCARARAQSSHKTDALWHPPTTPTKTTTTT
jgi:hypothetical protein